ncbi:hypothetical protein C0V75_20340 [Tabrizicola sp. TH137]|nr:hypothetical protein C0V75_20340 [Tabrizicola sp. TH137]
MAIIADILTQVDAAATAVGATAFDAVAAAIVPVFRVGSVLVVALIGINLMAQAVPMTLRNGLGLMVRITVASAFLSSWTNFNSVYGVLTNAPSEIGAVVMNAFGDGSGNLYEGLDALYLQALDVGQAISQNGSYITGALAGLLMFLVAALMATVSIIVISAAKIMIGVLVIFAPVAIACTLYKVRAASLWPGHGSSHRTGSPCRWKPSVAMPKVALASPARSTPGSVHGSGRLRSFHFSEPPPPSPPRNTPTKSALILPRAWART